MGLTNPTLKVLDPNSSYYQRRKLLLEIKDAVEGTKTATSVSSIGPDNIHTPPSSGSPILNRLGSGSRAVTGSSSYGTTLNNNSNISISHIFPSEINVRTSFDDPHSKMYRSPAEETPRSLTTTPMALQPLSNTSRPSLDTLEPLDDSEYSRPNRHSNSPRPMSDPDVRQLSARLPAQVTIETAEYSHKIPSIAPRQSSMAYSVSNLRPNLNVPPQIVPRMSSREYSTAHGFNVPHSGRGMSPVSPPSPVGGVHPFAVRPDSPLAAREAAAAAARNGMSLNERRNNPLVPHIQTQSLVDGASQKMNGRPAYESESGRSTRSGSHSDATVVGGTLGFGRRPSHKRNHSSADVIQYPVAPEAPPKVCFSSHSFDTK